KARAAEDSHPRPLPHTYASLLIAQGESLAHMKDGDGTDARGQVSNVASPPHRQAVQQGAARPGGHVMPNCVSPLLTSSSVTDKAINYDPHTVLVAPWGPARNQTAADARSA